MIRLFLILILNCFIASSWASNELRELEYAEEIESSFSTGGIVWLKAKPEVKAKEKSFLALYTQTEPESNVGTAIILHPMGGHPNQAKLIKPLRTFLPQHNWASLSLQMPVLSLGAKEQEYFSLFDEASTRIEAALAFLESAEAKNIVLIGYGLGGMMALYYLKNNSQSTTVKALVTISLAVPKTSYKNAQITDFIEQIEQPVLDIFAEYDLPEVVDTARKRKVSGASSKAYRQIKLAGEGHLYQHDEGLLVKRVYSWMNRILGK